MTFFPNTARPASSPWGSIQQADRLAAGIWSVMTASHGGILLSDERQEAMPEALRLDGGIYEEDCDWSLVVLAFEDELAANDVFSAAQIQLARDTARCWHPDQYEAHTGEPVPENTSHILKTRNAYRAALGHYCTTSAWGDWADWVPDGKTGVIAMKVESVNHLGRPTYSGDQICALIDKNAYESRAEVNRLDDFPHEVIEIPESLRPKRLA